MAKLNYQNDRTRAIEEAEGSDGRLNVSSRADPRGYYNSRDVKRTFTVPFVCTTATAGEYFVYWKNTSTTRELVISSIGVNSSSNSTMKLWFVTGTASAGTAVVPTNMNKQSSNSAEAVAQEGAASSDGIQGLSTDGLIDFLAVPANSHDEFRLEDRLRLGEGDAIAVEFESGSANSTVEGVIFGYYEDQ